MIFCSRPCAIQNTRRTNLNLTRHGRPEPVWEIGLAAVDKIRQTRGALYVQVANLLKRRILNRAWLPGEKIPSIEKLAEDFNVAVVTVRQAIALLEDDGFVQRRQGSGTFITELAANRKWVALESTWDSMLKKWESSSAKIVHQDDSVASPILDSSDGIPAPAYRFLRRVHFSDDLAYAVINIYVDRRLFGLAPERFDKEMVILVLQSLPDVKIAEAKQTITIGTADIEVAELLGIPVNSPVGEVRRVITDSEGTVIYVGEATYRGDLVRLESVLKPDDDADSGKK